MRVLRVALLFCLVSVGLSPLPAFALEGPRWLCEGEKATGFRFDEVTGVWREAGFPVEEMKWVFATRQIVDYGALAEQRALAAEKQLAEEGRAEEGASPDESAPPEEGLAEEGAPPGNGALDFEDRDLPMRLVYSLSEYGKDWPVLQCQAREVFATLQCEFGAYAFASKFFFRLNTETNRFMLVSPNGYVEGPDTAEVAPTITIGRCTLF